MENEYVNNILKVYNLATDAEKAEGVEWYNDAQKICRRLSEKFVIPFKTVCYVMAALSPNNKWHRNIVDCERVCRLFAENKLDVMVEAYRAGDKDALKGVACTYTRNTLKAFEILATNDVSHLGNGLKTNNFAQNIYNPTADNVTVDFHAISVAMNFRHTIDTVKSINFKGKNYERFAEAYRKAGEQVGLKGYEIQAVTWVAWRNLDKAL